MSTIISSAHLPLPNAKRGWSNIWCAGYDEYTPLKIDSTTGRLAAITYKSGKHAGKPIVQKSYHHLKHDDFGKQAATLDPRCRIADSCDCPPGPHGQLAGLLEGFRTTYSVGDKTFSMYRFAVQYCERVNLPESAIDYEVTRCDVPREILLYGSRGSGKSEMINLVLLKRGTPDQRSKKDKQIGIPDLRPPRVKCYLEHPKGAALILRKNESDLGQFHTRCLDFFRDNGIKVAGQSSAVSNMYIKLTTGYEISFGHISNQHAYEKHLGLEYDLIWIEEGGLIPDEVTYMKIRSSNRSRSHEIRPMIVITTNPGLVGSDWIDGRFAITKEGTDGAPIYPAGTPIPMRVNFNVLVNKEIDDVQNIVDLQSTDNDFDSSEIDEYKISLLSTVDDNPYKLREGYDRELEQLKQTNQVLYRQWRWGDWKVKQGAFFSEIRINGPRKYCDKTPCVCAKCEPPQANHNIKPGSMLLAPYWPLLLGLDIGFGHYGACLKARIDPAGKGILRVYGEMVRRAVLVKEWGRDIAEWVVNDLQEFGGTAILSVSQEMWGRKGDEYTLVQQLAMGIDEVIGKESAYVQGQMFTAANGYSYMPVTELSGQAAEYQAISPNDPAIWEELSTTSKTPKVVIVKPKTERRAGLSWIRELLRWWPARNKERLDQSFAVQLFNTGDMEAYTNYLNKLKESAEVLPKLTFENCPQTLDALLELVTDPDDAEVTLKTNKKSDDISDALRYLCVLYRNYTETLPFREFIAASYSKVSKSLTGVQPHHFRAWHDDWRRNHGGASGQPFDVDHIEGDFFLN